MIDFDMIRELRRNDERLRLTEVKEAPRVNFGSANPSSWPNNLPFFRTDLGFWIYYDGTRWLTVAEYECIMSFEIDTTLSYAVTTAFVRLGLIRSNYQVYLTRGEMFIFIGATNSGVNYMIYTIKDSSGATVWTFNTSADAAGAGNTSKTTNTFTQPGAARTYLALDMAQSGSPSAQFPRFPVIFYRLIIP